MKKKFQINTKLNNNIICYDLETSDKIPYSCEPLEITAIVYDINTLLPKENGIFHTLIKPTNWDKVNPKALEKNKLTKEEIEENGVDQKFFFDQFTEFCRSFQRNNTKWEAMYSAGFNILNFDNIIMDQLCYKYGYVDKDGSDTILFHPFHNFDLLSVARMWFHNCDELASYSLDGLRDYMGISKEGSHRSTKDVEDCWKILSRFITYYRQISPKKIPQFRNCFGNE